MIATLPQIPKSLYVVALLVALIFVTYHSILPHEFMLDDHGVILTQEEGGKNIANALNYQEPSHVFFRPVTNLFRLFLTSVFPQDPVYYHALNIILFCFHVSLVFIFLKKLLGQMLVPFLTCLFYALHPVNATFINYITGHEILLFGLLLDVSAICLLYYCDDFKDQRLLGVSLVFYVLALFAQEISIAFVLFVLVLLVQMLKNVPVKRTIGIVALYGLVSVGYAAWRLLMVKHTSDYIQRMVHYGQLMNVDAAGYLNSVLALMGWYIGQLVSASQIILIKTMPLQTEGLTIKLVLLAGSVVFACVLFIQRWKGVHVLFSLLWFATGLLPLFGLALIYPYGGFVIEPHWFFFSSIGFFLCLALSIHSIFWSSRRIVTRWALAVLVVAVVLFWSAQTQRYNLIFRSQESYCRYWLTISPDFYFPNFWLARDLVKQSKLDEAEAHFKKSFIGQKNDWLVYAGLGDIEAIRSDFPKAGEYYREALKLNPDSVFLKNNVDWLEQKLYFNKSSR